MKRIIQNGRHLLYYGHVLIGGLQSNTKIILTKKTYMLQQFSLTKSIYLLKVCFLYYHLFWYFYVSRILTLTELSTLLTNKVLVSYRHLIDEVIYVEKNYSLCCSVTAQTSETQYEILRSMSMLGTRFLLTQTSGKQFFLNLIVCESFFKGT